MRFNKNATTNTEALEYVNNRAKQLLRLGYRMVQSTLEIKEWGLSVFFEKGDDLFQVIYLLEQFRGSGKYKSLVKGTILTSYQCNIEEYLRRHKIPYVIENLTPYLEYRYIQEYYGDGKANRSGVYFMNHIDEGLAILNHIEASSAAKKAFCLHPIVQTDDALLEAYKSDGDYTGVSHKALLLAMEYRSVANEYLSTRTIKSIDEIRLSPLKDVNDMLIADKVQNCKDFELYHIKTHPRSKELEEYFDNWFDRLGVNYLELKKIIE